MQKIIDFVNGGQYASFEYQELDHVDDILDEIARSTRKFYHRQFVKDVPHTNEHGYHASSIGRNIWLQLFDKFFDVPDTLDWISKRKQLQGLVFEEEVYMLLNYLGMLKIDRQSHYSWVFGNITLQGHPDFIITDPDSGPFILECKEVDDKKYKRMLKEGMGLQYEMQLAFYMHATTFPGMWLVSNRDTKEMFALPYTPDYQRFGNCIIYMQNLDTCPSFDEAFSIFPVPRPVRHGKSNYRYIPYYYYQRKGVLHPVARMLYDIDTNERDSYIVTGYNFPVEYKAYEPTLS